MKQEYTASLIKTLKRNLLLAIIKKPIDEMSKSEINIAYELSKDDDIQHLLKPNPPHQSERHK